MAKSAVFIGGLMSSIGTALLVAAIAAATGRNIFTFSMWLVVPVGAIFCGVLAASGYYVAARLFHQKAGTELLIQMLVVAACTQLLIYFLEYGNATGWDFSRASFFEYLAITLTGGHYHIYRGSLGGDIGEVGGAGYLLALIQFVGFIFGAAATYIWLESQPFCAPCRKYLKMLGTRHDSFDDEAAFAAYYDSEFEHPIGSPAFAAHVGPEKTARRTRPGTLDLFTTLRGCPGCKQQLLTERVFMVGTELNGELDRVLPLPEGADARPAYFGSTK